MKIELKREWAPVRELIVDQEVQKNMITRYHKKQEEEKKMLAQNEEDYLNSV